MALYYGKKQISGGRDYKTEHQMEDYSVSFVDDGEGYTDAAAALSEINSGSKFGKLFAAIKGCLMKFLSSISSLSSDLTALQNKATELQNTITELENKATELQEKTTTLENGLTSCNSDYMNLKNNLVYRTTGNPSTANWFLLGKLNMTRQGDTCIIRILGGEGQNSNPFQNLTMEIFIKKGYQSTSSTTAYYGVSYWFIDGDSSKTYSTSDVKVKVMCTSIGNADVWVYFSWPYPTFNYRVYGKYDSFTYSGTFQSSEPTDGTSQTVLGGQIKWS